MIYLRNRCLSVTIGPNKHTVLSAFAVLIKRMKCQLDKVKESSIRDKKYCIQEKETKPISHWLVQLGWVQQPLDFK